MPGEVALNPAVVSGRLLNLAYSQPDPEGRLEGYLAKNPETAKTWAKMLDDFDPNLTPAPNGDAAPNPPSAEAGPSPKDAAPAPVANPPIATAPEPTPSSPEPAKADQNPPPPAAQGPPSPKVEEPGASPPPKHGATATNPPLTPAQPSPPQAAPSTQEPPVAKANPPPALPPPPSPPGVESTAVTPTATTATPKKLGRPKGAKNKAKTVANPHKISPAMVERSAYYKAHWHDAKFKGMSPPEIMRALAKEFKPGSANNPAPEKKTAEKPRLAAPKHVHTLQKIGIVSNPAKFSGRVAAKCLSCRKTYVFPSDKVVRR